MQNLWFLSFELFLYFSMLVCVMTKIFFQKLSCKYVRAFPQIYFLDFTDLKFMDFTSFLLENKSFKSNSKKYLPWISAWCVPVALKCLFNKIQIVIFNFWKMSLYLLILVLFWNIFLHINLSTNYVCTFYKKMWIIISYLDNLHKN